MFVNELTVPARNEPTNETGCYRYETQLYRGLAQSMVVFVMEGPAPVLHCPQKHRDLAYSAFSFDSWNHTTPVLFLLDIP